MSGQKDRKTVTIGISLKPEELARVDRFVPEDESIKRAQVGKRALMIGLAALEGDPNLLFEAPPVKKKKTD